MSRVAHVFKIGGSLLAGNNAAQRLRAWRERIRAVPAVIVVGGGSAVDELRRLDAIQPLGVETAHWLAIDQMAINARVVAAWLELPVVGGLVNELGAGDVVFDPRRFLREEEVQFAGSKLPIGWATTSDSIAARLATALGAELTLLKNAPPPADWQAGNWAMLAKRSYVDAAFPILAGEVASISFESLPPLCNLPSCGLPASGG